MLQCVAVCCSVLQCVAVCCHHVTTKIAHSVCCNVLQCVAVCCSVLQCVARVLHMCCSVLQCVVVCCSVLQCVAVCCSVLQCVTVCCNVLQCLADSSATRKFFTIRKISSASNVHTHPCTWKCMNVYTKLPPHTPAHQHGSLIFPPSMGPFFSLPLRDIVFHVWLHTKRSA